MPTREALLLMPGDIFEAGLSPNVQELNEEPSQTALLLEEEEIWVPSSKALAPVDHLTGMPLPVLPPKGKPNLRSRNNNPDYNWHHHYHPSNDQLLTSAAGLAVRHLRLQYLPVQSHHNKYHHLFSRPEKLPRNTTDRLGHIILACAGYIPTHAIDVLADDPSQPVILSNRMRHRLQTSGEIEVRGHSNISTFIRDVLVKQDFSNVDQSKIDEFLDGKTPLERKQFLGHWLLAIASEVAVEPVKPVYRQALEEGLILAPAKKLPNIVKAQINGQKTSKKAIKALHRQLSRQRSNTLQPSLKRLQLAA